MNKKKKTRRIVALASTIFILALAVTPLSISAEAPPLTAMFPADQFWDLSNANFGVRFANDLMHTRFPFSPTIYSTSSTSDNFPFPVFGGYLSYTNFVNTNTFSHYGNKAGVLINGTFQPNMPLASIDSYIYLEFTKAFGIPKGQQMEFYISCYNNTFIDNDSSNGPQYIYFNYVSNVTPGSFPSDPLLPWVPTEGIEVMIEREVFEDPFNSRIGNMTRVIIRNVSTSTVNITGMQFRLRESNSHGEPIPTTGIHNIGVNRSDLGLLLSPVLRYRYNRDDQVMDEFGEWLDQSNVNIGPDGNVLPRPGYDAGELAGEEEALEMYEYLANMFEADVLDAAREGNQLWTDIFESVYAIPCILLFSGAGIIFVMTRALIGR